MRRPCTARSTVRALDPGPTGLRSARTSVLSLGQSMGVFGAERTDDALATRADAFRVTAARS